MKVKNRKIIRQLSMRPFRASGKRNLIAATPIALTTILFTSLFTIALSINSSYQAYTFRQIGGYAHGTYKEVTDEQMEAIKSHRKVKEVGRRITAGVMSEGNFSKIPAEISYMDSNQTKWSYIELEKGHEPEKKNEIIMDTKALELLGISPVIGAKITLTYDLTDKSQSGGKRTDTFVLSGWWKFDEISPVHFMNVSELYINELEAEMKNEGLRAFRTDLSVMLPTSLNIEETMEKVEQDLGYQNTDPDAGDYLRFGVNWGYTSTQTDSQADPGIIAAIAAFILLVVFTGYLIIYNIFQISVTGDIRFYGLLKTIGVTPGQLKRMIRQQALFLCLIGCPVGLAVGYLIGYLFVPIVISRTTLGEVSTVVSTSPWIFVGAALFSIATVLLSCSRPGRMASKVSPVEAVKYTEVPCYRKKERKTRGAHLQQMAYANLGRNRKKTFLVILSLSLAIVLLAVTFLFANGFSMEKYLKNQICADFIVGNTDYFRFRLSEDSALSRETVHEIKENTKVEKGGEAWAVPGDTMSWLSEEQLRATAMMASENEISQYIKREEKRGDLIQTNIQIEGMDDALLDKLTVLEGSLDAMKDTKEHAIAINVPVDDYGDPQSIESYPKPGEKLTVTYVDEGYYIDSRTGEKSTDATPEQYMKYYAAKSHDVEYTVCALIVVPHSISYRTSYMYGFDAVIPTEQLKRDCGSHLQSLFYMFDVPDRNAEKEAESFLAEMTGGASSDLMYESKELVRENFQSFQQMFQLLGGTLCAIVGIVGILNFFNAILTGILSRKREFAMLQSIGMTGKQLKKMLILEGLLYAGATIVVSLILVVAVEPLIGHLLESMFWFFEYHFTVTAVFVAAPFFLTLGVLLPLLVYRNIAKMTIVERLRESE